MNALLSLSLGTLCLVSSGIFAQTGPTSIAQPTTCIATKFTVAGSPYWKSIDLKLTNNCGKSVDFQNATVSYKSKTPVNTNFWGDFAPLSYPDNALNITSQAQGDGSYLATMTMHFPVYSASSTQLPAGKAVLLKYGVSSHDYVDGSAKVYLSGVVVGSGSLALKNNSTKPANVSQTYALVHLSLNGQNVKDIQAAWGTSITVSGLSAGTYTLAPENITASNGTVYKGGVSPASVVIVADKTVNAGLAYTAVPPAQTEGKINIKLGLQSPELVGYSTNPSVLLTQSPNGNTLSKTVAWNNTTSIGQLTDGGTYNLSSSPINYNSFNCAPIFNPALVIARSTTIPLSTLTYQCVPVNQASINIDVKGAPTTLTSLKLNFTPTNNAVVSQTVNLSNGAGTASAQLAEGMIYNVTADSVAGYSSGISPQPFTVTANANLSVNFTKLADNGGRIITYIPGWKTPPSAQALVNAGYTHVMIAFGVFSTSTPGVITPAFDTVTKTYIQSLHQAGIKVVLSLGGASSSVPNTTTDFHQVLASASTPEAFKQTFINSLQGLITNYGFDGFDIDIEHGLNGGGTFSQPQGDIAVLASIINTMHNQTPGLLITLTPQVANIAATSGFDGTWGNYASLVMQTHDSLAWVGIQLYNTGCAYGINQVCYGADPTSSPDFSVAMATDLLANWPAKLASGSNTGFQPYISYLKPSQIVIGYPAANASGASDGAPATPTSTIKRALNCLKTAVPGSTSCANYLPPKAYGAIGGVFNWEVTYDQNNNFKFATELKSCVINGLCN